jgi:hypothetical protein
MGGGNTMVFKGKKSSLGVSLLFILTAFVGMQTAIAASGEPPVANAGGPYLGEECNSILLNASGSNDPEGDPLTYRWNIGGLWIENYYFPYMQWTWFDDFSGVISLEVSDGTNIDIDTAIVTISNVPPEIFSLEGPTEVDVGAKFYLLVNFFDGLPDPRGMIASLDTYSTTFSWGDGSSTALSLGAEEFLANASHMYTEKGVYHIISTIVDNNGGDAIAEWDVMVGDIAQVEAGPDSVIDEGSMFLSSGFLADTDSPTYTVIVDYGDETGTQELLLNTGNTFDLNHTYYDNGVYTVLVTVFNEDVEYGSDTANVTVNNIPPSIISMSVSPTNPLRPGVPVELTVMFSDPGILDTHTVTIKWGDGTSTNYTKEAGFNIMSGSHIYVKTGNYEIVVTLTDDDGGTSQASMHVVVNRSTISLDVLKGIIVGLKIPKGLKNSLLSKLENVLHSLEHHKIKAAIHQLRAFINFVEAQRGKKLSREEAKELMSTARSIIVSLKNM